MAAVRQLVVRASDLQREIVAAGKGGASPREFYKRNHRWTEGLLSGAKAVAIACQALMYVFPEVCVTCDLEYNSMYMIIFEDCVFYIDMEIRIRMIKKENIYITKRILHRCLIISPYYNQCPFFKG